MINFPRYAMRRVGLALLATAVFACGEDAREAPNKVLDATGPAEGVQLEDAPTNVRACEVTAAGLGFNLYAGETYSNNIFPIVQQKCVRCHGGDQTDKQNSTTCGYMEKNIVNVIKRLQNMAPADALKDTENAKANDDPNKLNDDAIRNQISGNNRAEWPMPPVNRNRNQNPGITPADIDTFIAWKDAPNKCSGADTPPDAELPVITSHTDDEDVRSLVTKAFETAACEDGPKVATDWTLVESLVAIPDGGASSFYDYAKHDFVAGAVKMTGDCSIDALIALLKGVSGAEKALQEYKNYGWRAIQCSIVDGRPRAYLAHLARVPNTLGDKVYGIYLKDIHIEQRP